MIELVTYLSCYTFFFQALWLHRRFLSLNWIMYFACNHSDASPETGESIIMNEEIAIFIDNEIRLLDSSMTVPDTKFEDFQAQALHAAVYTLWLTKVTVVSSCPNKVIKKIATIVNLTSAEK